MSNLQIKNILTPIVGIIVAWLARKFPMLDSETWNTLVSTVVFGICAVVLGFFNRPTNILDAAGSQPGTTVVTTKLMADSLPDNKDVIAATPELVRAVQNATPPAPGAVPKT